MSTNHLFPFHPISGMRLNATVDFIPAAVPRDIEKEGDQLKLGEASESCVHWNGAQEQAIDGVRFLADDNGNECLESEAVWHPEDVEQIVIQSPGTATYCTTPNELRDRLTELGRAGQAALASYKAGACLGEPMRELESVLQKLGLLTALGGSVTDK